MKNYGEILDNRSKDIKFLYEMYPVLKEIDKNSNIIYATHNELAFEIDSVREVVSRRLKSIEKSGYIRLERGKIVILKNLNEIVKN